MYRHFLLTGTVAIAMLCSAQWTAAGETVSIVAAAAFPNARQPQAAVDPSGRIYLVFGSGNSIFCTTSNDRAATFIAPRKVGEAGVLAVGMRRGPRVAATQKEVVVTAIAGALGHGKDGDVLAWRSGDHGNTWQGPARVNSVVSSAREGLHQLAAGPNGDFYCVWLDLQAKSKQVYGSRSTDGGQSSREEHSIYKSPDGGVCPCCQPQVAFSAGGALHVMWRNQLSGVRDMYLSNSDDNGRTFDRAEKLGHGTWPLDACPMDGGGLACDAEGNVTTIWRRDKNVFRCIPGQPEESLGEGGQGWAAAGADGVHLIWTTGRAGRVMTLAPNASEPRELGQGGSDPVIAGAVNGKGPVFAAWEQNDDGPDRIRGAIVTVGR